MKDKETTLLSLRVSPDLASKFKVEAARRNMRQNRLFEEILTAYLRKGPESAPTGRKAKA